MKYDIKIDKFGTKRYYVNNILHRENGPAVVYVNGDTGWFKNGNLHREDGPAVEYTNGAKFWYLNNIFYGKNGDFTNKSWKFFIKTLIFS